MNRRNSVARWPITACLVTAALVTAGACWWFWPKAPTDSALARLQAQPVSAQVSVARLDREKLAQLVFSAGESPSPTRPDQDEPATQPVLATRDAVASQVAPVATEAPVTPQDQASQRSDDARSADETLALKTAMAELYEGSGTGGLIAQAQELLQGQAANFSSNTESGLESVRFAILSMADQRVSSSALQAALARAQADVAQLQQGLKADFDKDRERLKISSASALEPRVDAEQGLQAQRLERLAKDLSSAFARVQGEALNHAALHAAAETLAQRLEAFSPPVPAPILGSTMLPVSRPNFVRRSLPSGVAVTPSYLQTTTAATLPADLANSSLVSLDGLVSAKAKELNYEPLAIINFVRSQIRSQTYAGAMKNAAMVLQTKAGNAEDQASLLAALLRAAKTPARYVHGIVKLPKARLAANLGIAPEHLERALIAWGIAFEIDAATDSVAFEHTWVSAKLPYQLYRGSYAAEGDRIWLPLDTFIKPLTVSLSTQPMVSAGVSGQGFVQSWIDGTQLTQPIEALETALANALASMTPAQSLQSASGRVLSDIAPLGLIPNSLTAETVRVLWESSDLPAASTQRAHIALRDANGQTVFDATLAIAQLLEQRTYFSYPGASVEDAKLLLLQGGLANTPPYLVSVRPVLKNHRGELAAGKPVPAGVPLQLQITLSSPAAEVVLSQQLLSGPATALFFAVPGDRERPDGVMSDLLPDVAYGNNRQEESDRVGRLLWNLAQQYVKRWDQAVSKVSDWTDVSPISPLPQVVLVLNQMTPQIENGRVTALAWRGVAMDAQVRMQEPVSRRSQRTAEVDWLHLSALQGSVNERRIFKDLWGVDAVSAEFGFKRARDAGIAIRTLAPGATLDGLVHAPDVLARVQDALAAGLNVQIPQRSITDLSWSGSTWREYRASTGESGYFISGQYAGGITSTPPNLWFAQGPATDLISNGGPLGTSAYAEAISIDQTTQGQIGIVGQPLAKPLTVVVLDRYGRPVPQVQVRFELVLGLAKFAGNQSFVHVTTNGNGRASAPITLGQDFRGQLFAELDDAPNPFPIRAGVVYVEATATVYSEAGASTLRAGLPLVAFAKPDQPTQLVQGIDMGAPRIDQNGVQQYTPLVRSYPYRGWFKVQDQYGNAVSNVPVTITVPHPAGPYQDNSTTYNGAVFATLRAKGATEVSGECPAQTLNLSTCLKRTIEVKSKPDITSYFYLPPGSGAGPVSWTRGSPSPSIEVSAIGLQQTLKIEPFDLSGDYGFQFTTGGNIVQTNHVYNRNLGLSWVETALGPLMGSVGADNDVLGRTQVALRDRTRITYSSYLSIENFFAGGPKTLQKRVDHIEYGSSASCDVNAPPSPLPNPSPCVDGVKQYSGNTEAKYWACQRSGYTLTGAPSFSALGSVDLGAWTNGAYVYELVRPLSIELKPEQAGALAAEISTLYNCQDPELPGRTAVQNVTFPVTGATVVAPALVLSPSSLAIDGFGRLANSLSVRVAETSNAVSGRTVITLFEDGVALQNVNIENSTLNGTRAMFSRGMPLDPSRRYSIGMRINVGTALEQTMPARELTVLGDLIAGYGVYASTDVPLSLENVANARVLLEDDININEGESCKSNQVFAVHVTQPSRLTLKLYKLDQYNNVSLVGTTIVSDQAAPLGVSTLELDSALIPEGNYRLEVTATAVGNSSLTQRIIGSAIHRAHRRDLRSLGHTEIQGVDLFSGGYATGETDVASFGRGPSLALTRSYFSHVGDTIGPFGRGWSSSLDQKIQPDSCGRVRVQGSGGQGQVFVAANQTDAQGWAVFRPLHGYHGSLRSQGGIYEYYSTDGTRYVYGESGALGTNISFVEDPNGNRITASYTQLGGARRLTRWSSSNGRSITVNYVEKTVTSDTGQFGEQTSAWLVKDVQADGVTVSYSYDDYGNLETVQQNSAGKTGFSRRYRYDNFGSFALDAETSIRLGFRLAAITDVTRNLTQSLDYAFATSMVQNKPSYEMRVRQLTQADGMLWKYTYTGVRGQQAQISTEVLNPRSLITTYQLNGLGATFKAVDPIGTTTTLWNTAHRKPAEITDRLGRVRSFTYDDSGNLTSVVFAGRTQTHEYAPATQFSPPYIKNRLAKTTSARGDQTQFTYDARGNLISTTLAGVTQSQSYLANGDVNTRTDGKGGVWQFVYHSNGLVSSQTDALGGRHTYLYDARGRKSYETDETNATQQWTFDLQGRVLTETNAAGTQTTSYDDLARRWSVKNRRNFTTTFAADAMGRVVKVTTPASTFTEASYDGMGNKVQWTDLNGTVSTATYDALDRLLSQSTDVRQTTRTLDAEGRLLTERVSSVTPAAGEVPRTVSYVYDGTDDGWIEQTTSGLATIKRSFDANGQMVSQTDALNRVTTLTLDDRGRVSKRVEPGGLTTDFTYDANDQVLTETRGSGWKRTYTRDAMNRVLSETDGLTKTRSFVYDLRGLVTSQTDRRGGVTTFIYDGVRRLKQEKKPENRTTNFTYDGMNNVILETRPNAQTITRTYDNLDRLTQESDGVGMIRQLSYDAAGRVLSESRDGASPPANSVTGLTSYTLDPLGRRTQITQTGRAPITQVFNVFDEVVERSDGVTTQTSIFDALGRKTSETRSGGSISETHSLSYDAAGNVLTRTDAKAQVSSFEYDARNRLKKQTDPSVLGTSQLWTYDLEGNVLSHTDRRGVVRSNTYDLENRKLTTTRNGVLIETLAYDGEGAVLTRTDARGNETTHVYDFAGRKRQTNFPTVGTAATALWTYNAIDLVLTHTDGSGKVWTYTYDTRGRKLTEVDGLNRTTRYAYNSRDELISKTTPKMTVTGFKYNAAGDLVEVKDALNKLTSYQYDNFGNRTALIDANNKTTSWSYGFANRLMSQTWPDAASRSFTYDLNGNLASETTENGAVLTHSYDALDRKITLSTTGATALPNETTSTVYTLDAGGNVLSIAETTTAGTKTETRSYDTVGRLESVTDRNGKLRSYQYDAADNRVEEKDHTNQIVTHAFDARNRLASTVTPELGATTYTYDGADRLAETSYANLSKEIRSYDAAGQLTQLKHERAAGTLHSEIYEYDANSNRTKLTQNDGTSNRITTYTFDSVDRVLSESNPDERLEDTLDAVGNRTQRLVKNGSGVLQKTITYTINARDQITRVQEKNASNVITKTENFGFDADGSRISKSDGTTTTTYKYDRRGRQVQAGTTTFELNDADVRTAKTDGARTEYVMEGLKLVAEVQGATTLANYRWGGQLIGESRGGTAKTILQDRFRSPLIVLDQAGLITDRVRYTAAGEVRQRTGSSPLAFGYGGYLTQNGTDELYAFARTYAPGLGRFNEVDPIDAFDAQMPMGPHRYVLGYGNPLVYVDPDGRQSRDLEAISRQAGTYLKPPPKSDKDWLGPAIGVGLSVMLAPVVYQAGWVAVANPAESIAVANTALEVAAGDALGGTSLVAGATIATAAKLGDEVLQAEKVAAQVIVAESKAAPAVVVKQVSLPPAEVPAFNPLGNEALAQMSPNNYRAYLLNYAKQIRQQESAINNLTVDQYLEARTLYEANKRNADAAQMQKQAMAEFQDEVRNSIFKSQIEKGISPAQAKAYATTQTKEISSQLAALHNPDMVAGGYNMSKPTGMGMRNANSAIGASWNGSGRLKAMDAWAAEAASNGHGAEQMNVRLHINGESQ